MAVNALIGDKTIKHQSSDSEFFYPDIFWRQSLPDIESGKGSGNTNLANHMPKHENLYSFQVKMILQKINKYRIQQQQILGDL